LTRRGRTLLLFAGAVATGVTLHILRRIDVLPGVRYKWVPDFLLSGFIGGILTGDPAVGAVAGFIEGCTTYLLTFKDGTTPLPPCFLFLISSFIGGLLRKKLFRRRKDKKTVAEGPVDDAGGRDILKP